MIDAMSYNTWIFDCDGVILDSNQLKTDAFFEVALPYGKEMADLLVRYHMDNGGVSRFEKFRYFFETILDKSDFDKELESCISKFGDLVKQKLISCPETEGAREFLESLPAGVRKIIVSGGSQEELRKVFAIRGLDVYFDSIFGSPDTKESILKHEVDSNNLIRPALFIGDSKLDYESASKFEIDFLFMSNYSEFENWEEYFKGKNIYVINSFNELLS